MRAKAAGFVSTAVLLTTFSGLLNLVQGIYNFKFYRAEKKADALEKLSKFQKDLEQQFQSSFNAAVKEMKGQAQRLDPAEAETIRVTIRKLASDRSSIINEIKERENGYRETFNKSYPLSDVSWVHELALDTALRTGLKRRYTELWNHRSYHMLGSVFSFASIIEPSWVEVKTKQSVKVRSAPTIHSSSTVAIPPETTCTVLSVSPDRVWLKVRGKAPNPFEGWVYIGSLEIPSSHILS